MVSHQAPSWNTPPKIALAFMSSIKALRRAAPWSPMMFSEKDESLDEEGFHMGVSIWFSI